MMKYEIEELIPIVKWLTEKYTSKESSSVTYETAQKIMEAVIYCIEYPKSIEQTEVLSTIEDVSAKDAYHTGYELILEDVKETLKKYNDMMYEFDAYENKNYYDTVTKAISEFFKYYNPKFEPQATIITMDYPTIKPPYSLSGIIAIKKYVEYISYEQKFLSEIPKEYVISVLSRYENNYREQFYNICSIVLRNILADILIGKSIFNETEIKDYEILQKIIEESTKIQLSDKINMILKQLIEQKYNNDKKLYEYLKTDSSEFAAMLIYASEGNSLENAVVL